MRLRLKIQRNELPTVSTLWPISDDTQLKNTIAWFLNQVNLAFPLESDTWGLEHYSITVGGYECLHYHELGAVCKDEDEVVIKPLSWGESKARLLTGRNQISRDGRHLLDGVPFGRPAVRGVVRPDVRIPPRKRRRLLDADEAENVEAMALVRVEDLEGEEGDEEDEDDEDFEMGNEEEVEVSSSEDGDSSDDDSSDEDDESDTSDTSESQSDEDENASEESWDGIESEPPTSPNKKAARQTELGKRMTFPADSKNGHAAKSSQPSLQQSAAEQSLKRKSSTDGTEDTPQKRSKTQPPTQPQQPPPVPPGEGKEQTKLRNARKRDAKKLFHLKKVGVLGPDADLKAFHEWQAQNQEQSKKLLKSQASDASKQLIEESEAAGGKDLAATTDGAAEAATAATEKDTSTETLVHLPAAEDRSTPKPNDSEATAVENTGTHQAGIEKKRQQLLKAISKGGVDVTSKGKRKLSEAELEDEDEAPEELSTRDPAAMNGTAKEQTLDDGVLEEPSAGPTITTAAAMVPPSVARRSKLDLTSSKRLLFGSLGVRVPKTQEEKDALQKKLSDRAKQRVAPPGAEANTSKKLSDPSAAAVTAPAGEQEDEDPEAWRSKINLTAVECIDENVTLSTPPFPFHQRWDPQYKKKKAKSRTSKQFAAPYTNQKARKTGQANGDFVETYDKYNADGNGDALDYDDEVEGGEYEEYWEEGALLDAEYEDQDADEEMDGVEKPNGVSRAAEPEDDGFPELPHDISTLPSLAEKDARIGDFVTYTELVCSAATSWQPSMVQRTAQLTGKSDNTDTWTVKLAARDVRPRQFDDEGNRIYSKFEMEDYSDNEDAAEEDERVKSLGWDELGDVRLLLRPDGADQVVDGEEAAAN